MFVRLNSNGGLLAVESESRAKGGQRDRPVWGLRRWGRVGWREGTRGKPCVSEGQKWWRGIAGQWVSTGLFSFTALPFTPCFLVRFSSWLMRSRCAAVWLLNNCGLCQFCQTFPPHTFHCITAPLRYFPTPLMLPFSSFIAELPAQTPTAAYGTQSGKKYQRGENKAMKEKVENNTNRGTPSTEEALKMSDAIKTGCVTRCPGSERSCVCFVAMKQHQSPNSTSNRVHSRTTGRRTRRTLLEGHEEFKAGTLGLKRVLSFFVQTHLKLDSEIRKHLICWVELTQNAYPTTMTQFLNENFICKVSSMSQNPFNLQKQLHFKIKAHPRWVEQTTAGFLGWRKSSLTLKVGTPAATPCSHHTHTKSHTNVSQFKPIACFNLIILSIFPTTTR